MSPEPKHGLTMPLEQSVMEIINSLIFTKSNDWAYEKEFRLVIPDYIPESLPYALLGFKPDELTAVYMGCRMSTENKGMIKALTESVNPNTDIHQAILSKREYKVDFHKEEK